MSLPLGPRTCSAAGLQISENADFPLLETFAMHVPAGGARVVVAYHADRIFNAHRLPGTEAFAGYAAPSGLLLLPFAGRALPTRGHGDRLTKWKVRE